MDAIEPSHPPGRVRRFLQCGNSYAAQALIPLRDDVTQVEAFARYLRDVADRLDRDGDFPDIARHLRLAADGVVLDGDGVVADEEWADLVELHGYAVPADLDTAPYDAVVHDEVGSDGSHRYRPVAFVRRGTPVRPTGPRTNLVEVWIDPGP